MSRDAISRSRNAWARDRFGLTYAQVAALTALVVGHRLYEGRPIVVRAIEQILRATEDIYEVWMAPIERRGFVKAVGKFGLYGNQIGYVPTALALSKFPALAPLASTTPMVDAEKVAA